MFTEQIKDVIDKVDDLRNTKDDHWQIPRGEAQLLAQLVRMGRCKSICEIGMSYGFSTLHLTAATAQFSGHLHSIDKDPKKTKATGNHLVEAGLSDSATLHLGDALEQLAQLKPETPFDFVFIDAVKEDYVKYLDLLLPLLDENVTIVADNATTHTKELAPFIERIKNEKGFTSTTVSVGNGIELSVRRKL